MKIPRQCPSCSHAMVYDGLYLRYCKVKVKYICMVCGKRLEET